jgi:hypothetical protein
MRHKAIHTWTEALHSLSEERFPWNAIARQRRHRDLREFERSERDWFKTDLAAWSCFGGALTVLRCHRAAYRWFANWRQRQALRPWALFNIMTALVSRGRFGDALEAGRLALEQPAGQHAVETRLTVAWLEANAGEAEQAQRRLADLKPAELQAGWRVCLDVINAATKVGCAQKAEKQATARAEWERLRSARNWSGMRNWQLGFRRLLRETLSVLAAQGAGWGARVWAQRMTWHRPWSRGG